MSSKSPNRWRGEGSGNVGSINYSSNVSEVVPEKILRWCRSLVGGLGCDVKSHHTVESASYSESHSGAVQESVRNSTLQVNGDAL